MFVLAKCHRCAMPLWFHWFSVPTDTTCPFGFNRRHGCRRRDYIMTMARSRPDRNVKFEVKCCQGVKRWVKSCGHGSRWGSNHVDTGVAGGQRGSNHVETGVAAGSGPRIILTIDPLYYELRTPTVPVWTCSKASAPKRCWHGKKSAMMLP